jgi:hypothetical protein
MLDEEDLEIVEICEERAESRLPALFLVCMTEGGGEKPPFSVTQWRAAMAACILLQ